MQANTVLPSVGQSQPNAKLKSLANKLESQFLAEMLKASGVGKPRTAFGGGAGEDHFSSFLTQEYAEAIVRTGGLGLSETIYLALIQAENRQ